MRGCGKFFSNKCPQNGTKRRWRCVRCDWCEEELQAGEEIYALPDGMCLCTDCLWDWAGQFKEIYEGVRNDERF